MSLLDELREARAAILGGIHVCDLHQCPTTSAALSRAHAAVQEAEELIDAIRGVVEDRHSDHATFRITSYLRDCHIKVNV